MSLYSMFPRRFGSCENNSVAKAYVDSLADKLAFAYNEETTSLSWAELYATAVGLEWVHRYIGAQANNAIPELSTDLDHWERILGIGTNHNNSDTDRRALIAAKRMYVSNTLLYLKDVVKKLVGATVFDDILATNDFQFWDGYNPSPDEGYPWVAGICHLVVHLNALDSYQLSDYDALITKIHNTLQDLLPIYSTLSVSVGEHFMLDVGFFNLSPLD